MTSPYSLANALLAPLPKEDAPYFEALGRFIAAYASAEAEVHQLARGLVGISDAKARILISGMRLGDVIYRVRNLLCLKKATKKYEEVDTCLVQLDVISKERDKLVHRDVSYAERALRASNQRTAKSLALVEVDSFSDMDLLKLEGDCYRITLRLLFARVPSLRRQATSETKRMLKEPWLYKPRKPNPRGKLHPSTA